MAAAFSFLLPQPRLGLWHDEVYSLELSRGAGYAHQSWPTSELLPSLPETTSLANAPSAFSVWTHQGHDTHPPLYFLLLRVWRAVFGESVFAARALSIAAMLVATACVMRAAQVVPRQTSPLCGLIAGLTVALSSPAAWYAQEVRDYAMAMAFLSSTLLAAGRVIQGGGARWQVLLILSALCALLTHYFTIGPLLGLFAAALLFGKRRARITVMGAIVVGLFAVLWLPALREQLSFARHYSGWIQAQGAMTLLTRLRLTAGGLIGLIGGPPQVSDLLGFILILLSGFLVFRGASAVRPGLALALFPALGCMLMLLLADLALSAAHLLQIRYALFALPPLALLTGVLWAAGRWGRVASALILLMTFLGTFSRPVLDEHLVWPEVIGDVRKLSMEQRLPIICAVARDDVHGVTDIETRVDLLALMIAFHLQTGHAAYTPAQVVAQPLALLDGPATPALSAALAPYRAVIFISAWRPMNPETALPGWHITGRRTHPGLGLFSCRMEPGPPPVTAAFQPSTSPALPPPTPR